MTLTNYTCCTAVSLIRDILFFTTSKLIAGLIDFVMLMFQKFTQLVLGCLCSHLPSSQLCSQQILPLCSVLLIIIVKLLGSDRSAL